MHHCPITCVLSFGTCNWGLRPNYTLIRSSADNVLSTNSITTYCISTAVRSSWWGEYKVEQDIERSMRQQWKTKYRLQFNTIYRWHMWNFISWYVSSIFADGQNLILICSDRTTLYITANTVQKGAVTFIEISPIPSGVQKEITRLEFLRWAQLAWTLRDHVFATAPAKRGERDLVFIKNLNVKKCSNEALHL